MDQALSFSELVERDVEEFEGDLKRYRAANRRSVWVGLFVLAFIMITACMVCSAVYLLFG